MLALLLKTKSLRFEKIATPLNSPFEKSLREVPSRSPFEKSLRKCPIGSFRPRSPRSFRPRHRAASGRAWWSTSLAARVRPRAADSRTAERDFATFYVDRFALHIHKLQTQKKATFTHNPALYSRRTAITHMQPSYSRRTVTFTHNPTRRTAHSPTMQPFCHIHPQCNPPILVEPSHSTTMCNSYSQRQV